MCVCVCVCVCVCESSQWTAGLQDASVKCAGCYFGGSTRFFQPEEISVHSSCGVRSRPRRQQVIGSFQQVSEVSPLTHADQVVWL